MDVIPTHSVLSWLHSWDHGLLHTAITNHAQRLVFNHSSWIRLPHEYRGITQLLLWRACFTADSHCAALVLLVFSRPTLLSQLVDLSTRSNTILARFQILPLSLGFSLGVTISPNRINQLFEATLLLPMVTRRSFIRNISPEPANQVSKKLHRRS